LFLKLKLFFFRLLTLLPAVFTIINLVLTFYVTDSQDTANIENDSTKQIHTADDNNNQGLAFSRKNLILTMLTALCAFLGIVLLSVYLIYGKQLQDKQGDYSNLGLSLSDGDDSRKNIPINSTIGK
jgi:hypothetical protein